MLYMVLRYTSYEMGIFIFKPVSGRVVFVLTFSWTGWFRNYRFWDGLQFFLPFNSRFLDVDGQKLCEQLALGGTFVELLYQDSRRK
jgi:hypothetical protein